MEYMGVGLGEKVFTESMGWVVLLYDKLSISMEVWRRDATTVVSTEE